MAIFQANTQFSIDNFSLGFEVTDAETVFQDNVNKPFQGGTYQDFYSVTATDGSQSRRFEIYGTGFTTTTYQGLIVPTGGTIQAVAEYSESAGDYAWFATGISTSVSTVVNALLSSGTQDDIQVIASGLSGNDTITLSDFDDVMRGYAGNDTMTGGGGNDILDGGNGSDTAVYVTSFANATITFEGSVLVIATPTEGTDRLTNFEFVNFNGDVRSVTSLLPPNDPPVPTAATANATEDGPVVNGQLVATDAQGDTLTFARTGLAVPGLTINANGSYSFSAAGSAYQSLAAGQTQQIVVNYSVSDGRASANSTLTITVTGVNDAPGFELATRTLTTSANTGTTFTVTAIDVDGDTLTYTPSDPAHGTVTLAAGVYTYTPDAGYTGSDTFTVQASDGKGGTATQSFTVTISAGNAAPVINTQDLTISTPTNTAAVFTVIATDANGDTLTYSAATPANGTISGGANGQFTYTPKAGFTGTDSIIVTVNDGKGGTDTETFTVTVGSDNAAPVIANLGTSFSTLPGAAKAFTVTASDADGDTLTYTASNPPHGSVSGGANGKFTYTPDAGFTGTDTITITVSDGNGGTDTQVFTVSVGELIPSLNEFALLASSGFSGSIGGYGNVFGTAAGVEMITVLDVAGAVKFDPSFNKGNDGIHLSGNAADWTIIGSGSAAILSDGDTFVEVPAGVTGMAIAFDDGIRVLRIDTVAGTLRIGNQAFDNEDRVTITAPAQNVQMQHDGHGDAFAQLIMQSGGTAHAGGVLNVFGTATGDETINLEYGDVSFDPSFNKGDDTLVLDGAAQTFTAYREGSNLILSNDAISVDIPVGINGMTIAFTGSDDRVLKFDTVVGSFVLGDQQIGFDPIALAAA